MTDLKLLSIQEEQTRKRPKANDNKHILELLSLGFRRTELADCFGCSSSAISEYISGTRPCPYWTVLCAKALKAEKVGQQAKTSVLVVMPKASDLPFLKDFLQRSNINFTELKE